MNSTATPSIPTMLMLVVLGVLAILVNLAVFSNSNVSLPLIATDRGALVVLGIIGMAMCALGGIGPSVANGNWTHPITIAGIILGVLILLLIGGVLLDVNLPLISSDRTALAVVTLMIVAKIVLGVARYFTSD